MKKYFLFAAVTIALAACNNNDNIPDEPVAVQISATIGQSAVSRAADESWGEGDAIGITMSNRYQNVKYTEAGDGKFTGTTKMYFKNKRDPETISAYYPYAGTEGQTPALMEASTEAENQTSEKQSDFDFLYASEENVNGENPNVNLKFSHMMSKLTLNFINGNGAADIEITKFSIEGLVLEGTFNPLNGVCAVKDDVEAQTLTILPTTDEDGQTFPSLIVFPQAANSVTLKIKDSQEQDYKCDLNFEDDALQSGNNYMFNITVNKTELSVNGKIIGWTEVNKDGSASSDD